MRSETRLNFPTIKWFPQLIKPATYFGQLANMLKTEHTSCANVLPNLLKN